ncbi:hypothetical protein N8I77_004780 [Diaporthe amygdali]|uniref:Uncharacterized protein n=1 Tax=Phomopsis amygdali TaxID=1214568 RepID=A0AAD9W8Z4_PHOAM|nr:hypothetical protein N8I77_004780 [Diaporthe amygdali]
MFATVYPHHRQPLPRWPFSISINSLLSVYTLVLKTAIGVILTSCIGQLQWTWYSETRPLTDMLRFDNATRGAAGALDLIWRQRFRRPLTVLGCVIMVLALVVDPFVQQLVQPADCSVEVRGDTAAATLPRTNVFYDSDSLSDSNYRIISKELETALYNAIFSPGQSPPYQCSTGNCTFFDTYSTIGLCYSCQDTSEDVIIKITCSAPDTTNASQHPKSATDCPVFSGFSMESNFSAGQRLKLGTKMKLDMNGVFDNPIALADADSYGYDRPFGFFFGFLAGATINSGGRIDWTTSDNFTCDSQKRERSWGCQGYGAATCSLNPCVNIYNATISAGILEEHLVASSSDTAWGTIYDIQGLPVYNALIDTQCSAQIQTLLNQNSSVESRWLPYDLNVTDPYDAGDDIGLPPQSDFTSLLDNGCLYLTSHFITKSLPDYFTGMVRGLASMGPAASQTMATNLMLTTDFQGPELIRNIYNWGHTDFERVQSIFSNISDSLTTYIRTHGRQQLAGSTNLSKDAQGKMYHNATCLQVRWPWISFPASLTALATIFFLVVVEATGRRGTSVWKASPLAWVLRADGLGNEQISSSSTRTCEGMEERSKQIAVHLFDEGPDGPRIRMADLKDPNLEVPH